MILFRTEFTEYFNKKIHIFLDAEIFYDDSGMVLDDLLDIFFPKYLIREQRKKCKEVMEDLFDWTGDDYWHTVTAFHEMGLYYFLEFIQDLRKDTPEFDSIYYDKEDEVEIKGLWGKIDIKGMFEGEVKNTKDLADFIHDIGTTQELCFEDTDFLLLPDLSNNHSADNIVLEELMGIDFDYYKELLPKDIRLRYEKQLTQLSLFDGMWKMLDFIADRILYRGLHKAFWDKDRMIKEPDAQVLLDSLFAAYLKDKGLDISREVDLGTGKIDFKFYKNYKEKVLIEVKLGNNLSLVEKGIKNQLPHYMDAAKYEDAFYLVICHSKKDIEKIRQFFENYKPSKNIVPLIFDASKKTIASKLVGA